MEYINKIEIAGKIGTARTSDINGKTLVRFSVATNHSYKDVSGFTTIETTWHNVTYWLPEGGNHSNFVTGAFVHITGRLRNQKYTTPDGTDHYTCEIIAHTAEII